jgi:hypothetical protein
MSAAFVDLGVGMDLARPVHSCLLGFLPNLFTDVPLGLHILHV